MHRCHIIFVLLLSVVVFAQETSAPQPDRPVPSASAPVLSEDQVRELIRKTAENDMANDKKQRDYTYIQREEVHKLDGKGQVKSTEIKISEILAIYGEQVERLISKNDKPLSDKDARKEEEKIQKLIEKRKNESEQDRKKREEREEKARKEDREFVREVADAFNFRVVGMQLFDGRETYVIDADPRPGYQPHLKQARILPKFRFRAWIDKDEEQWRKLDVQCIDTVTFGVFLARIHKGSRLTLENTRVNNEVWLPQHIAVKLDARLALVKNFNFEDDITYRDYKKFRSDTKITPLGEISDQP